MMVMMIGDSALNQRMSWSLPQKQYAPNIAEKICYVTRLWTDWVGLLVFIYLYAELYSVSSIIGGKTVQIGNPSTFNHRHHHCSCKCNKNQASVVVANAEYKLKATKN